MTSTLPESHFGEPRYFQPKSDAPIPYPKPIELMTPAELIALVRLKEEEIVRLKDELTAARNEIDACNHEIAALETELEECEDDGR